MTFDLCSKSIDFGGERDFAGFELGESFGALGGVDCEAGHCGFETGWVGDLVNSLFKRFSLEDSERRERT